MHVVWHHDELIKRAVRCRYRLPSRFRYRSQFLVIEQALLLEGTDGDEVGA
jgi:hypothetical protein